MNNHQKITNYTVSHKYLAKVKCGPPTRVDKLYVGLCVGPVRVPNATGHLMIVQHFALADKNA